MPQNGTGSLGGKETRTVGEKEARAERSLLEVEGWSKKADLQRPLLEQKRGPVAWRAPLAGGLGKSKQGLLGQIPDP